MGPGTQQPKSRTQAAPGAAARYERKRRAGGGRPKKRKNEGGAESGERSEEARAQLGRDMEADGPPAFQHVPFKSILEAEAVLVFGDWRDAAAQKPSEPLAFSGPQLKCQSAEIQSPPSGPNLSFLPQIDKWLHVALQDASSYYRRKKYAIAASRFSAAMELCSKGAVLGRAFDADYEDISKVTSFIQSKLVTCYLRLRRPDLALPHAHRSIYLNPVHYGNHFRQAVVYRLLGRTREAARSAMIADFVYRLCGGSEQRVSSLIKCYWQAMLEQAISREERFSVMYTPCNGTPTEEGIEKMMEIFRKKHPTYTQYLFTDPSGGHLLPQTTQWTGSPSQRYALTLGFRRQEDGDFLDKLLTRKCPIFTGSRAPFAPLSVEDLQKMTDSLQTRILPVLDFLKCTKLAVHVSAGSGLMERLQLQDYLGRQRRTTEQTLVLQQALAELAVAPYLQDFSHADAQLVGLLEELLYEQEQSFLRGKVPRRGKKRPKVDRKPRGRRRTHTPTDHRHPGDHSSLQQPPQA